MLARVLEGVADDPFAAFGLIGLIESPELGAICFACIPFNVSITLGRFRGACLVFDPGVEILGVLANDDEVDVVVAGAHPGVRLARAADTRRARARGEARR